MVTLTFESVDEILKGDQMKATEQNFLVVLFIMLYKVVLTFEFVDEILKCDHSDESCWAVLFCGAADLLWWFTTRFIYLGTKAHGPNFSVRLLIKV